MAKIVTASNGKKTIKMSKAEWQNVGVKAGWMKKEASFLNPTELDSQQKTPAFLDLHKALDKYKLCKQRYQSSRHPSLRGGEEHKMQMMEMNKAEDQYNRLLEIYLSQKNNNK